MRLVTPAVLSNLWLIHGPVRDTIYDPVTVWDSPTLRSLPINVPSLCSPPVQPQWDGPDPPSTTFLCGRRSNRLAVTDRG